MRWCINPHFAKFFGLIFSLLFVVSLWIFKAEVNNVLKTQLLYVIIPVFFGYLLRYIFFIDKENITNVDYYLRSLDFSHAYDDFIQSIYAIFSLRLKKPFVFLFSVLYILVILVLTRLNGGFYKHTSQLLLSSIPLILWFLLTLGNLCFKRLLYLLGVLEIGLLSYGIYYQGVFFLLDFLLFILGIYVLSLSLLYSSSNFYKLGLLFTTLVPFLSLLREVALADFFANCAYFLLLVGTLKTLFSDLVLASSGVTYKHEDVF